MSFSTTTYPYDTVVYITDTIGTQNFQGSGVLISPDEVLTASHVVYSADYGAAYNITVSPGYNAGVAPYGSATGTYVHYFEIENSNDSISLQQSQFDYAVIHLSRPFTNLGTMGLQADFGGGWVNVTGFPGAAYGQMENSPQFVTVNPYYTVFDGTSIGSGSSGGPVWVSGSYGRPYVVGVVSSGQGGVGGTGYFTQITAAAFNQIEAWVAEDDRISGQPTPLAASDFNADHKSDVLWRQTSGATYVWTMNGSQIVAGAAPPTVDPSWVIQAAADFTGDGKSDILWRNGSGGATFLWTMNGGQVTANTYLGTVDTSWTIQGTGDFSANGNTDVLWRNTSGAVVQWVMNGNHVGSTAYVSSVDPGWKIQATGDFTGDGKADILWRNSSSGAVNLWAMDGSNIVSNDYIATVASSWDIKFVGDFNGDGKADLLWRQNTGAVNIWTMDGASVTSNDFIAAVKPQWLIDGVGDYNGDGKADVLWRDSSSGAVNLWAMNGSHIAANTYVGTVDNSWSIQHV